MKMLDDAAKLAAETKHNEKHFLLGCIAERQDGVLVKSTNAEVRTPEASGHAEARSLRKAGFGATLWVARVLRDGSWAMAKPCKNCKALIKNKGVKKVYYTTGPNSWESWNP